MSEGSSTSAPAAPAPAAAQPATPAPAGNTNLTNAPPPASQEALSLSDAGRLLARRRQEAAREAQGPGQPAQQRLAATPPQQAQQGSQPPTETTPARPSDSYDTIARALGLDAGAQPAPDGAAPAPEAPSGLAIDGTHYTAQQLRQAVLQAADYTKKTQDLAAQRQQLEAQAQALAQVLPHIQPELAKLGQSLQSHQPPDPTLIDSNPTEYLRQMHQFQQAAAEQQRLGSLTQLQQEAYQRHVSDQVEAGNRVLGEKYEFWRDDAMRTTVQRDIATWALEKGGYSRQELQGLSDPRHVESMMKAMMFDRWMSGAKTTAPAQQIQSARVRGTAPPPAPAAAAHAAEQAFEAAPNVRNAAALLSARRASTNGSGRY